jgi:hypothetical protein
MRDEPVKSPLRPREIRKVHREIREIRKVHREIREIRTSRRSEKRQLDSSSP